MKNISVIVETLSNGAIRVTGRHEFRTIAWKDASPRFAKVVFDEVMVKTCSAWRLGDGTYDLTYIELNDAAQALLNQK